MSEETKLEGTLPEEWEAVGCKNCKSPFHSEEDCPKAKNGESKFQFRSRKEMGLEPGELPFKFRVEIDPEKDDVTEIARKRALLRLNSDRVYKQMAFSTQAADAQKAVLNWLLRLGDNMDDEEKKLLAPVIREVQASLKKLQTIQTDKVNQAVKMEELVTKGRRTARKARLRILEREAKERKHKLGDFWVTRLPDSSLDIPVPTEGENPLELFEKAAEAILEAEKDKSAKFSDTDP